MQMLAAYLMARQVRRARARKKAQLIMRLLTAEFSAMVLKTMAMKQYRRDIRVRQAARTCNELVGACGQGGHRQRLP